MFVEKMEQHIVRITPFLLWNTVFVTSLFRDVVLTCTNEELRIIVGT